MSELQECQNAVAAMLEANRRADDGPIDLLPISPQLIALGYTQHDVNEALDLLVQARRLEYLRGCRVLILDRFQQRVKGRQFLERS